MTGFNPYDRIDLHSPAALERLIPAIIQHENGAQPYSREQILRGISDYVYDPRWSRLRDRNTLSGNHAGQSPNRRAVESINGRRRTCILVNAIIELNRHGGFLFWRIYGSDY